MKIHLLDGTYELFRAYFGAPPRTDSEGREVGATIGLLTSFLALLRQEDTTHVAVAFDHVIESFRNELFDGYKTGEGIEPALRSQFELVEEGSRALGLVVWPMVEFEADDAMAAGAAKWCDHPEVEQVMLCSPDKDLAQCVKGERVVCFDRRREIMLDEPGVVEKFGVSPESIPDYLALVGDSADGIPGIPRWGAKSTATVLARYGHLEQIPDRVDDWDIKVRGGKTLAENLAGMREESLLYRHLATLRTDIDFEEGLEDLAWQGARGDFEVFCERLGAPNLAARVERWA